MRSVAALAVLALLVGCERPPPDVFTSTAPARVAGEPAGNNARGEPCLVAAGQHPTADAPVALSREVFCGGWTQPAARIVNLQGRADAATLQQMASGGLWRRALEARVVCSDPADSTRLSNGAPALLLRCTRRNGGWPHLALVAIGPDGEPVMADGLATALPVIDRLITNSSGPSASRTLSGRTGRSDAMQIAVARLAADAYGAADVARYEQLMAFGRDLNQAEAFAGAEEAYRAALAVQQRVLGRDDPNTVTPMLALALNLSNQGRATQAAPLFVEATRLAPRAADPTAPARLVHYRGIDALNRGDPATAVALLEQAEGLYLRAAPAAIGALEALPAGTAGSEALVLDVVTQSAVLGLAEARRYRGVALARQGRAQESVDVVASGRGLLRKAGMEPGLVMGRGLRSMGGAVEAAGRPNDAMPLFTASAARFTATLPGERPEALTLFLSGTRQQASGRRSAALASFRAGARILKARQIGLPAGMVLPYLDALAAEAAANPSSAAALQAEMFAATQLARRDTTARLVAQASARLGASGGERQVSEAVRRLQDRDRDMRALFAARDLGEGRAADIDRQISEAQAARAEAEEEVAAAAPGYRQLLQAVAEADAVAPLLAPNEALVTMLLGPEHGYVLLLRGDSQGVTARRLPLGEAEAAALVARVRAGMEPRADGSVPPFDMDAAAALYQALFGALADRLQGVESLLVAADGPLLSVPFGLLLTAPAPAGDMATAPWLLRSHAVVHMPAPSTLLGLRTTGAAHVSAAPLPYAGFGDPLMPGEAALRRSFPPDRCRADAQLARSLGALPATRAELVAARQLTGAAPDAIRLGPAFTAAAMRGAGLDRYRVVHFATHALMPGELSCLDEPSLIASLPAGATDATPAFIPASQVLGLKLNADLVILSACNTGTPLGGGATGTGGEGLSALARAFFFAGARGVMATHWAVNDAAAALTVTAALERQSQRGVGSAAALRGAQLFLLEEAGRKLPASWAHPYYWAPFALIGDGRRIGEPASQAGLPPRAAL